MKVLVTGGAGFIGSHLIDRLLKKGEKVVCVDNFLLGEKKHLREALKNESFDLQDFDLLNMGELDALFKWKKFDFVYHLAANSDIQAGYRNSDIDYKNTFLTTFNILNCMKKYNLNNIVFASSSAIYGEHKYSLNENTGPLEPISNYGAAKLASEAYLSSFSNCYNIRAWIIRFPNVVGWRLTHGVIYDFLNKLNNNSVELVILGNGKQRKPYLFIKDLLDAFEKIVEADESIFQTYNVSSKSSSNVDFIADSVVNQLNCNNVKKKYTGGEIGWIGDVPNFSYDTKKIENLGWVPKYTSNEAVKEAIKREINFRAS